MPLGSHTDTHAQFVLCAVRAPYAKTNRNRREVYQYDFHKWPAPSSAGLCAVVCCYFSCSSRYVCVFSTSTSIDHPLPRLAPTIKWNVHCFNSHVLFSLSLPTYRYLCFSLQFFFFFFLFQFESFGVYSRFAVLNCSWNDNDTFITNSRFHFFVFRSSVRSFEVITLSVSFVRCAAACKQVSKQTH